MDSNESTQEAKHSRTNRKFVKPIQASAHDLIKIAKKQKKNGDLEGAIETFRKAYQINKEKGEGLAPVAFLQLPMYLQAAGKNDEGWTVFNKLFTDDCFSCFHLNYKASYYDIYDKMRLFLQREKKMVKAVPYGVVSHIEHGVSNFKTWKYYEKQKKDAKNKYEKQQCDIFIKNHRDIYLRLCSDEFLPTLRKKFTPLLKKAKKLDCMDKILIITQTRLKKLPQHDIQGIHTEIEKILYQQHN